MRLLSASLVWYNARKVIVIQPAMMKCSAETRITKTMKMLLIHCFDRTDAPMRQQRARVPSWMVVTNTIKY
eukprot:scaffold12748_cov79-Skeletonema_marinoi.AAC.2